MSQKILLVYDDYAEMMRMQTDLMKIGFDVVGIVNEALMNDQLLTFNPQVVITAGRGGKVSAPNVAQKLKENSKFHGRVMVLLPGTQRLTSEELSKIRVDALLELPSPMSRIIQNVARLLRLDAQGLLEKSRKARIIDEKDEGDIAVKSVPRDRASRYEKALKGLDLKVSETTFDRKEIRERQENMKKDWDFKRLEDVDEAKRQFAKALFKK